MSVMKREDFKGKHLVFVTTYYGPSVKEGSKTIYETTDYVKPAIELFFHHLVPIVRRRDDTLLVIIDNGSAPETVDYLKKLPGGNVSLLLRPDNAGRPRAVNEFIAEQLGPDNLPASVWVMDPDLIVDQLSFDLLADAVVNLPQLGLLGMRYKKNSCNPELYIFRPPRNLVGLNGRTYSVVFPFMANVAGPVMAMTGRRLMETLKFKFFPFKEYHCYGQCDAVIHDYFKWRGIRSGYLNGTLAIHLKSAQRAAEELIAWAKSSTRPR
ncbi:MAG: glycosyltransferase [Candidatus Saganbacteria bacterium]|nr:glycosyltransferase [Candidatus Saganbacteria bacterium]